MLLETLMENVFLDNFILESADATAILNNKKLFCESMSQVVILTRGKTRQQELDKEEQ